MSKNKRKRAKKPQSAKAGTAQSGRVQNSGQRSGAAPNRKPLSNALRYFFGVGDAGFVLMSNIETFYFMTFLTDLAGFGSAVAGVINSVFTTIDACLSWLYGGIINGTKAKKWGRYRSWLILVPWVVPFLYAFMFLRVSDNEILSAIVIIVAAVASHVVWNFSYVANATLVSVVGKTPEDKAVLSSSRATWNNIGGLLFSYLGLPFATLLAGVIGEKNQFAAAAFCLGWLMVVGYYAHFKMTEGYEEIEPATAKKGTDKTKITIREMFASLFKNPQLMILMLADLAKWCVKFVTAAAAIYYFRDAAGDAGLMTIYTLLISLGAIVGAFCMRYLAKSLSSRTTMILSYVGMAVFLFLIYVFYQNPYVVIFLMTVAQFFYGIAFASSPALYADTIVYSTWKTGKDASGWIMGLQNLPLKIGVFLRGVILSACLVAVGWESGIVLEGTARQGMTIAFALVPAILCAVGAVLLIGGFKITKEKVEQYQAEIDARA
ncbi:MAG TPA: MFS transporter [Candidatus Limivivens intestinipullorum]|uniref:MFS transporter n=1 Tax=Candidatus Limivivens intestinipullorum TaxID=2840858 RepID=A0A9D1EVW1_9FIRM|nr:MFS transporter [Candidatus Limivivens intestinipullorum]